MLIMGFTRKNIFESKHINKKLLYTYIVFIYNINITSMYSKMIQQ